MIILTIGAQASGKSSYARRITEGTDALVIERDMLRIELTGERQNFTREMAVTDVQMARAELAVMEGRDVIISDTNINSRDRRRWAELAEKHNVDYHEVWFDVPLDVCLARNATRPAGEFVPEDVVRDFHERYTNSARNRSEHVTIVTE